MKNIFGAWYLKKLMKLRSVNKISHDIFKHRPDWYTNE